jgi:hypothetical protein
VTGAPSPHLTRRAASLLIVVALGACGGHDEEEAPEAPPAADVAHADPPVVPSDPAAHDTEDAPPAPASIVRFSGDVRLDHGVLREGAPLERGDRLTVGEGGEVVVDLDGGDRVTLFGPALAMMGDGAAQLTLARGSAHLVLPPGPAGPRPPFRVATREASVEMVGSGEILLVENAAGATWVVALSGLARVENGEVDARHHARAIELAAAHALLVAEHPAEPTDAPSRLADARAAAEAIFTTLTPLEDARRAAGLARAGTDLDVALGWLEAEARHGHDLTEQHRAAVTAGRAEDAMRLQGELVGHAQQLHALRDAATARWERLLARVVAGEVPAGAPDPADARRERVAALLGFE